MVWGISLHYDLKSCNYNFIMDPEYLRNWMINFVDNVLLMKRYGECEVCYFGELPDKQGYTLIQKLTTSNVVLHCNTTGDCYLDVFTCSVIDNLKESVETDLFKNFQCKSLKYTKLERGD